MFVQNRIKCPDLLCYHPDLSTTQRKERKNSVLFVCLFAFRKSLVSVDLDK